MKILHLTTTFILTTALVSACGDDEDRPSTAGSGGFVGGGGVTPLGGLPGTGGLPGGTGGFISPSGGTSPTTGGDTGAGGGPVTGGTTGSGGTLGTGGGGGAASGAKPPCITDPAAQAFIIGDSYITGFGSPPLQPELAKIIPGIGQYKNYAGAGCSMVSGGICTGVYGGVPQQLTTALAEHPKAKFVIMDGGGNDVLLCDTAKYPGCNTLCATAGSSKQKVCTDIVQAAIGAADSLIAKAAAAGIEDVVYFFYPHIPANNGGYREILDYSSPLARQACENASSKSGGKITCYFVDMVEPFKAQLGEAVPSQFEAAMQVHPLQAGVEIIAKEVTNAMKTHCLGQQSGCCAP